MDFIKGVLPMKPNYKNLGFSNCMGNKLRMEVERQLNEDLTCYGITYDEYRYDWSESCIEGHRVAYLDGDVENFSGISVFNDNDEIVVDGWMEFIYEPHENIFIAYWEYLDKYQHGEEIEVKGNGGIPRHIFEKLPNNLKDKYKSKSVMLE